mmetsp:Transcript_6810/g.10965  ORF Transcript_6810/g.10965 Transcript_6810/m.10965 type:complete len:99 (-) Transcript_6810:2575-2871(-)
MRQYIGRLQKCHAEPVRPFHKSGKCYNDPMDLNNLRFAFCPQDTVNFFQSCFPSSLTSSVGVTGSARLDNEDSTAIGASSFDATSTVSSATTLTSGMS